MVANIRNLDYVILLCEDLNQMRVFYHETLGFRISRELDGWLEFQVGSVLLTLRRRGRPYDGQKLPDSAGVQLAFRVAPDDVDSCYAELLRKQVNILEEPRDREFGHRTLFFKDPEGNVLEIYAEI